MALALNKIIIAGAGTNTAGAYFQTQIVGATTTPGTVVPAGVYLMFPTANVTVTANNGSSFSTLIANNTGGVIISDGVNVNVLAASANANVTLITVNGGASVSGTFNS
tara:strand:+ start:109 stop:432 length:324 start_codon:yes stop_codon:yes gene_type:complete